MGFGKTSRSLILRVLVKDLSVPMGNVEAECEGGK